MPKASDPEAFSEVPRCLSLSCPRTHATTSWTHDVGAPGCDQPRIALTDEQRAVWQQPHSPLLALAQSFGRVRLRCDCGSFNEDFSALRHADSCSVVS